MKNKVSKASKRRLMIFGTLSFFMIGYFLYCLGYYIFNIRGLENSEKDLVNQLNTLKGNEQNLQVEIEKLKDPDYLARYARENYLYSKTGEYIIKMEPKAATTTISKISSINYKIIASITGGVILLTIIIINTKKKKAR